MTGLENISGMEVVVVRVAIAGGYSGVIQYYSVCSVSYLWYPISRCPSRVSRVEGGILYLFYSLILF